MHIPPRGTASAPKSRDLALLTIILFVSYLCVAISLPVVSVHVVETLQLGNFWAGLGVSATFIATIFSRALAGRTCDRIGASSATKRGLIFYAVGAVLSALSGLIPDMSAASFTMLLLGRLSIGIGESLVIVGVIAWGIELAGPQKTGRVMAIVGAAMYGALAVGGMIGLAMLEHLGFMATMLACAALPCVGLASQVLVPAVAPTAQARRQPFLGVLRRIWPFGSIVALQGMGFAAIGAFFALHFKSMGWDYAGLGLTAFGLGFVIIRVTCGHLPDRIGGLPVAIASLATEAAGLALIAWAPIPSLALLGAFLAGLGCSMIYPSMGREVVSVVAPQLRGAALSGFALFQDVSYALTAPIAGLLADRAGYSIIFAITAIAAIAGLVSAIRLRRKVGGVPA